MSIDLTRKKAFIGNDPIILTKKEFEILWTLAEHPGKVFSRENLLESLWGFDYFGDTRTVDTHIKRIRQKITHDGAAWGLITVYGVGYKFEVFH